MADDVLKGLSFAPLVRRRPRGRRKPFAPIEDLATHPEPNVAPEQLAVFWNVSVSAVRKWLRAGSLEGFQVGEKWRVKREIALAYQRSNKLTS